MLDLRRDLCARLIISAHKNKSLNAQFKKSIYSADWNTSNNKSVADVERSEFESRVSSIPINRTGSRPLTPIKSKIKPVEKIEDKVEKLISDPQLSEIQLDLEFAEQLLKNIKSKDAHNPKIPVIEQTIKRLKLIISSKIGLQN